MRHKNIKSPKPDEYFSNGISEMARFGNSVIMRNNMTAEQHEKMRRAFIENYRCKADEISNKVDEVRAHITKCDPLILLTRARDNALLCQINKFSESENTPEDVMKMRSIEYIQSVIVSSEIKGFDSEIREEQERHIAGTLNAVEKLLQEIQVFLWYWSFYAQDRDKIDDKLLEFIVEAQLYSFVRGERYQVFELEYLKHLLPPHDKILVELFGVSAQNIIEGLEKLEYSLTQARVDAHRDILKLHQDFIKQIDCGVDFQKAISESRQAGQIAAERAFGVSLNDVASLTQWTQTFIDALSYQINECKTFFYESEFSGWPIMEPAIHKKPFIKINNVAYCFDYYSLFDNIYRILRREIIDRCQNYRESWKDLQTKASEDMVKNLFLKLLPGAEIYTNNFYPMNNSLKQLAENDMLILYANVLIVVEIKAGSFPQTPPIIDYEAHIKAYKDLIEKADHQCDRTMQYINDNQAVKFYTQDKQEKFTINKDNYQETYAFSITVENINAFAARAEKMSFLNLKSKSISISYDDLLIYSNYFDSSLFFLHFLKQRKIAITIEQISLSDELDHLGMYIHHNLYSMTALDIIAAGRAFWVGYRADLDKYLGSLYPINNNHGTKPSQKVPQLIREIIQIMEKLQIPNMVYLSSYLLDLDGTTRTLFAKTIKDAYDKQRLTGIIMPVLGFGNIRYCVFINIQGEQIVEYPYKYDYFYATVMRNKKHPLTWIDLFFDETGKVIDVSGKECSYSDIDPSDYERLEKLSVTYAKSKIETYKKYSHKHKIGRNSSCPCGSGKKYKHCCIEG